MSFLMEEKKKLKKVLIIKLGAIGDVIHSTMLAQSIKRANPNCIVHFMTSDFITPLLENNPDIDKVIWFTGHRRNDYPYLIFKGLSLMFQRYDAVFPLSNSIRNYIMMFFMFPKQIIKRNKNRVHAVDCFYKTAVDNFGEIEKPKSLRIFVKDELKNKIQEQFKNYPRPWIIFNPGGANDLDRQGRIWDDDYWKELGNSIVNEYGGTIFICGSNKEVKLHEQYSAIKNSVILTGKMELIDSTALYSLSDLFISGDSGPLHIASALDIKVLAILGSVPKEVVRPYCIQSYVAEPNIDCKGCEQKVCKLLKDGEKITPCMKSIQPSDILKIIKDNNLLLKVVL